MKGSAHLPVAVHRALDEKLFARANAIARRKNCGDHRRVIAPWQEIISYGICRCDLDGGFLEVNEA